jgi:two-component system sensor histidine kinase HydH
LEALVNELLSYAKSGPEAMSMVNMTAIVSHVAALLQQEAEQLQIKIINECQENILIDGNRDRLTQVLLNVLNNSIQAVAAGGTVRITAGIDGRQVIIKVIDNGHGISQEEMPRIFEPFFTTKARGSGLGLALCRKIIEEHGGKITVQSAVGEGTSVSITIPIRRNHQSGS